MSEALLYRLEPLIPFIVDWKLKAVKEWYTEHSYESRCDQGPRTRHGYIYDRTYGFAKTAITPVPISVEGSSRQRFVMLRDDQGPPIAIWFKVASRRNLLTSNYWTTRTRVMRELNSIYDKPGAPELVICPHTILVDKVAAEMAIEDMWFTREIPHGMNSEDRKVVRLRRIYNRALGVMPEITTPQIPMFNQDAEIVVVRPRLPQPQGTGVQMPLVNPQVQPAAHDAASSEAVKKDKRSKSA